MKHMNKMLKAFVTADNVKIGGGSGSSSSLSLTASFLDPWTHLKRCHFYVFDNVVQSSKDTCTDAIMMSISFRGRSVFHRCIDSQQFNIGAEDGHQILCAEHYFCVKLASWK